MSFNCNTSDGRAWTSKIRNPQSGQFESEGNFSIEREHPTKGDFEGDFRGRRLKGKCLPDGMWFAVPADRPEFIYRGKYTDSSRNMVLGKRTQLGAFAQAEQEAILADDEWIGTRPPTFLTESARGDSSEEEAASTTEAASTDDAETTK